MKYLSICLIILLAVSYSCDQKIEAVLPLVGLYRGDIISCDAEELVVYEDSAMVKIDSTVTPFERRIAIAYIDEFVSQSDSVVEALGVKPDKKFLVIETNWLCLTSYSSDEAPLDMASSEDLSKGYPVVVEVKGSKKGRINFQMFKEKQVMMEVDGTKVEISGLTGFYYNASLQLEYNILKAGRSKPLVRNTMVGLKN